MMKTSPVFQKHERERKPLSLIIFKQLDSQIPINNNVDIPGQTYAFGKEKKEKKKDETRQKTLSTAKYRFSDFLFERRSAIYCGKYCFLGAGHIDKA